MSNLTGAILDELVSFFGAFSSGGFATDIAAQTYEPRASMGYTPVTDNRLVRLVAAGRAHGRSDWARVKRVIDDLSPARVEVLRIACAAGESAAWSVALRIPRARVAGLLLARQMMVERLLEITLDTARRRGLSPIAAAVDVLAAEASARSDARRHRFSDWEIESATSRAFDLDHVDGIFEEAHALIDAAVDDYIATRERLHATKRSNKARLRKENAALEEAELGASSRRRERKRKIIEEALPGGLEAIAEGVALLALDEERLAS